MKEYYTYLDSTPTHSYMKWLYKYPQVAFPYGDLVATNARRTRNEHEYELIDTGAFDADRYFDVFVEYAKASPDDCFIRITVANRGPETATIHLLTHPVVPQYLALVARDEKAPSGGGKRDLRVPAS